MKKGDHYKDSIQISKDVFRHIIREENDMTLEGISVKIGREKSFASCCIFNGVMKVKDINAIEEYLKLKRGAFVAKEDKKRYLDLLAIWTASKSESLKQLDDGQLADSPPSTDRPTTVQPTSSDGVAEDSVAEAKDLTPIPLDEEIAQQEKVDFPSLRGVVTTDYYQQLSCLDQEQAPQPTATLAEGEKTKQFETIRYVLNGISFQDYVSWCIDRDFERLGAALKGAIK